MNRIGVSVNHHAQAGFTHRLTSCLSFNHIQTCAASGIDVDQCSMLSYGSPLAILLDQDEDEIEKVPEVDWTALSALGKRMAALTSTPFFATGSSRLLFAAACRQCEFARSFVKKKLGFEIPLKVWMQAGCVSVDTKPSRVARRGNGRRGYRKVPRAVLQNALHESSASDRRFFVGAARRLSNELSFLARHRYSGLGRIRSSGVHPSPPCTRTRSATTAMSSRHRQTSTFATDAITGIVWSSPSCVVCRSLGETSSSGSVQDSVLFITKMASVESTNPITCLQRAIPRISTPRSTGGRPVVARWSPGGPPPPA